MDHGVWPWFTIKLYLERTGDIDFLFLDQVYFKDENICLGKLKTNHGMKHMVIFN